MEKNQEESSLTIRKQDSKKKWLLKSWGYVLCILIGILASLSMIYTLETNFAELRKSQKAVPAIDNEVKAILINTIKYRYSSYLFDDSGTRISDSQIECNCQLNFDFMQYTVVIDSNLWTVTNNETGEVVTGTVEQIYSETDII